MAFALLILGVVLLISAVLNTTSALFTLVKGDFSGPNNFVYWFVAILIIGMIGYIPDLRKFSVAFLALVLIVLFLKRGNAQGIGGGFFQQFSAALGSTQAASANPSTTTGTGTSGLPNLSTILPHL